MNSVHVDNVNQKPVGTADEVLESIHTVMHLIRAEQYRVLRDGPYDLTHMEGKILGYFARNPGSTLGDLAKRFGRDKGQMARLIKTVKDQGLLAVQETPGDRRQVRLQLTPEGRTVHQALVRQLGRLAKVAVKGFTSDERLQLAALLCRVQDNLTEES